MHITMLHSLVVQMLSIPACLLSEILNVVIFRDTEEMPKIFIIT